MSEDSANVGGGEAALVDKCANRLRAIQADTASAAPEQRREYFGEEVTRALKEIDPARRKPFLDSLMSRFPVAGQIARTPLERSSTPAPVAPRKPETLDELFGRFLEAASTASNEKRLEMARTLHEVGLGWTDFSGAVLEIAEEDRNKLGLPEGQQPRLRALVQLAVVLTDALQRLDDRALATMRELSPKNPLLKRPRDLRTSASQFLLTEEEPIDAQVKVVSGLLGSLMAAMLGVGRDFGRHFLEKFAPSAIEDVVAGEGVGGFFGPKKKERCWDKYVDLARDYATADLIDRHLKEAMAAFVEKKVPGAR